MTGAAVAVEVAVTAAPAFTWLTAAVDFLDKPVPMITDSSPTAGFSSTSADVE